ncbi:MAG: hypothetical protein HY215_09395 [Candidatus Rokubacteria bacterium]|nr:hypothetical protein [Candidatus Rokubacteria bacterium]
MAFFELIPEDRLAPEAKEYMEIAKRRARSDRIAHTYYVLAKNPRLVKAWVQAVQELIPIPNRFGAAQGVAGMLIAHAKGCRTCFDASRQALSRLGFDNGTLENMCQVPAALPLPERDRRFVEFTLRVARDPQGLKPEDFREMEDAGFSKDEILEMIGVAAYWNLATTLAMAVDAGLSEG